MQLEFWHQHIGSSSHQYAKLICQKTRAASAIHLKPMMQFLNPVFHVSTATIDGVNAFGLERKVRYHVAVVVADRTIKKTDNFSF